MIDCWNSKTAVGRNCASFSAYLAHAHCPLNFERVENLHRFSFAFLILNFAVPWGLLA